MTTLSGFRFLNDGRTVLYHDEVPAGGNTEVRIRPYVTVDGLAVALRTVDVVDSENWIIGPWPQEIYNDSDGYANFEIETDQATALAPISLA